MRIVVTGKVGQVAMSLHERAPVGVTVVRLCRPYFDLEQLETIRPAIMAARPDIIVNAAAFTAVDLAETQAEVAERVNSLAAGEVALSARELCLPIIQISTDYVFDGKLDRPYREDDATRPISTYGRSKLAGELAVKAATDNHVVLRTAWIYSPFGKNFVRTMLRLAESRLEIGVVADQTGNPTNALDIADAVFSVAHNLTAQPSNMALRGTFHMSAEGEAAWADVAEAIFSELAAAGHAAVSVKRITTADYPTPARRPINSRLESNKIAMIHSIKLPHWRNSLSSCVQRLLAAERPEQTL